MGDYAERNGLYGVDSLSLNIKFSEYWDKFRDGVEFTTIRSYSPEKSSYYHGTVGMKYEIIVKGQSIGNAVLNSIEDTVGSKIDRILLSNDVKIGGKVNLVWFYRIVNLGNVLLLKFAWNKDD